MCAGAIVNARVKRLVYGCTNPKAGAVDTLYQITTDPRLNHRVEVIGGLFADECAALLQDFFKKLRKTLSTTWRGDRVAEGARLEIVCSESYRGFESPSLRRPTSIVTKTSLWSRVTQRL